MPFNTSAKNIRSGYGKIIIAFLSGCIVVLLSLGINKTTFRQILNTVNQLSQPDPKITLVNNIFRDVVELDQLQRAQALQTPLKTYNPFLKESHLLQLRLDTLKAMSGTNTMEANRIDSMKVILHERDKLFINYLYLRGNLSMNDSLTAQVRSLSKKMAGTLLSVDSNLVTTEKKITTTTTEHADTNKLNEQSFWDKLFGRKKTQNVKQIEKLVKEELKVHLDTSALSKEDSIIQLLNKTISSEQSSRLRRRSVLINRQLALSKESNMLIHQLLSILRDVEMEASRQSQQKNYIATHIVDRDIRIMDVILILFICATAVLIYLVFADVARSNRYRKQLIIARDEAEQLGQVKQRFLANMSHELRTPLQTIIGISEQLKLKNDGQQKEPEILYHSSQHLLQIINEVLDYSRIISGRFYFEQKSFNMQQLIGEVKNTIQIQVEKKGLKFVSRDEIDPLQYYTGDPFRLRQILYNLLGNAIKFTDHGIVALYTAYKDFPDHAVYTFTIKDTGIGIEEHNIEKIFSEFETVSASGTKGTGLGLNIVKALVESQGGNIEVSSLPGHGSEFIITLRFPRAAGTQEPYQVAGTPIVVSPLTKVWIVDDDVFILQLCAAIFDKYHIAYQCFSSGEAALAADMDNSVTIALLDIRLPGISGIDLCHKLKEKAPDSATRFVALTAQVMNDEKDIILGSGFDDLLMKPFMEQELVNMVRQAAVLDKQTIDLSSIYKMAGNDPEIIKSTLQTFISETEHDLQQIKAALVQHHSNELADIFHRLASRCGQVGAKELLLQLRHQETTMREDDNPDWNSLSQEINILCKKVAALSMQIRDTHFHDTNQRT